MKSWVIFLTFQFSNSGSSTRTLPFDCYITCGCYRMFCEIVHSGSNDTKVMQWVIYLMESPLSLMSYDELMLSLLPLQFQWKLHLKACFQSWVGHRCSTHGPKLSASINWRVSSNSQDGPGLEILLVHPLRLAQFEDLSVAQILQTTFKLIQRVRLDRESTSDLFLHHLHHL